MLLRMIREALAYGRKLSELSERASPKVDRRVLDGLKAFPNCVECQCYPECRNDCPDYLQCLERLPVYRNK